MPGTFPGRQEQLAGNWKIPESGDSSGHQEFFRQTQTRSNSLPIIRLLSPNRLLVVQQHISTSNVVKKLLNTGSGQKKYTANELRSKLRPTSNYQHAQLTITNDIQNQSNEYKQSIPSINNINRLFNKPEKARGNSSNTQNTT